MELEFILKYINNLLEPVEKNQIENAKINYGVPTILHLGAPRSGSTFFTQWCAELGVFAYPSNFLSRFPKSPYIGALIYEMLINQKYNYMDEFSDISAVSNLDSNIGKTSGFRSPHEFWYFWRNHFKFDDIPNSNDEFVDNADFIGFNKELALIQEVFEKPFVLKGHIVNWYLKPLSENMRNAVYVHVHRDPVANIRSLLKARIKLYGSMDNWFSFKPREYNLIKDMDVFHQVAGQVYFTEREILNNRHYLGDRYINFSYEDLCRDSSNVYRKMVKTVNQFSDKKINENNSVNNNYKISNPKDPILDEIIINALDFFKQEYGDLVY